MKDRPGAVRPYESKPKDQVATEVITCPKCHRGVIVRVIATCVPGEGNVALVKLTAKVDPHICPRPTNQPIVRTENIASLVTFQHDAERITAAQAA